MSYAAGVAITTAATSAYITDITRRARYGAAHGVFGTIYDVGDALGPIAAGLLVGDHRLRRDVSSDGDGGGDHDRRVRDVDSHRCTRPLPPHTRGVADLTV